MATFRAPAQSAPIGGDTNAPRISRACRCHGATPDQRTFVGSAPSHARWGHDVGSVDRRHRFTGVGIGTQKKSTGQYSAKRAALGGRTLKTGQSRFFLGYKKHTFRLWIQKYDRGVLLVPLVSWVTPANVHEGCLLNPSVQYCERRWQWRPDVVVGDMGYIDAATKKQIREQWNVAVVTRIKENMNLVAPFQAWNQVACMQGQPLEGLGYERNDQLHWFGVTDSDPLCSRCWQAAECPRQFSFPPSDHESLFGLLPLSTQVAQRLLRQVRPWIEPCQSYEKNQLGLSKIFLNSLRLTWCMSLLADAAVILRALVLTRRSSIEEPLAAIMPRQMNLELD